MTQTAAQTNCQTDKLKNGFFVNCDYSIAPQGGAMGRKIVGKDHLLIIAKFVCESLII